MMDQQINNEITSKWIEGLALEELSMDESGVINFNDHLNPAHVLEESSIDFLDRVREKIESCVKTFNEYRGSAGGSGQIKIFKISNTVNDFMLFRNSLRLVFARKANDLISVGFLTNSGELFPARLGINSGARGTAPHEIRAHVGPFNNVSWRFDGEKVEIDALVKHYLAEFTRNSAK